MGVEVVDEKTTNVETTVADHEMIVADHVAVAHIDVREVAMTAVREVAMTAVIKDVKRVVTDIDNDETEALARATNLMNMKSVADEMMSDDDIREKPIEIARVIVEEIVHMTEAIEDGRDLGIVNVRLQPHFLTSQLENVQLIDVPVVHSL
jgi:ADP-dependent phosphofructokinase/glucokinase